eukprot:3530058-Rhodomonas_salina.1
MLLPPGVAKWANWAARTEYAVQLYSLLCYAPTRVQLYSAPRMRLRAYNSATVLITGVQMSLDMESLTTFKSSRSAAVYGRDAAIYGCSTAVYGCSAAVYGCSAAIYGCSAAIYGGVRGLAASRLRCLPS